MKGIYRIMKGILLTGLLAAMLTGTALARGPMWVEQHNMSLIAAKNIVLYPFTGDGINESASAEDIATGMKTMGSNARVINASTLGLSSLAVIEPHKMAAVLDGRADVFIVPEVLRYEVQVRDPKATEITREVLKYDDVAYSNDIVKENEEYIPMTIKIPAGHSEMHAVTVLYRVYDGDGHLIMKFFSSSAGKTKAEALGHETRIFIGQGLRIAIEDLRSFQAERERSMAEADAKK